MGSTAAVDSEEQENGQAGACGCSRLPAAGEAGHRMGGSKVQTKAGMTGFLKPNAIIVSSDLKGTSVGRCAFPGNGCVAGQPSAVQL